MAKSPFKDASDTNPSGIPKEQIMAIVAALPSRPDDFSLALLIATGALCRKTNWTNGSYMLHCLTVADPTSEYLSDEEKIVGILHDVVEDSDWTLEDLRKQGFSNRIVHAVDALTKKDGEKYFDAIRRCSINPIARRVKRRDNRHNMDLTRGPFVAGVKQKYHYQISFMYLGAIEDGKIAPNTPIWEFLQMEDFSKLMTSANYHYIAQQTLEPVPQTLVARFGKPNYEKKHPKVV